MDAPSFVMSLDPCRGRCRSEDSQQAAGVAGDHQLFVRGDDPRGDLTVLRADPWTLAGVGHRVEVDAQPGASLADPSPDFGRVFANAGGKDDPVDATQGRGQGPDLLGGSVDEI